MNAKVLIILGLALVHGVTYLFFIPPWQHPDEPTQFEFAWLISRYNQIPPIGTYDQGMRRDVAASMLENDFFKTLDFHPNLLSSNAPIWIGISQISNTPVYYLIAGLPLRLFTFLDVGLQLYLVRSVSLLMYLATIAVSSALVSQLTSPGHVLRWLVPLLLVLSPAFTDLMTAVNDDVGATLVFSLFLWLGTRMLVEGITIRRFLTFIGLAVLCLQVKNTISLAIPLALVLILLLLRRPNGVGKWAPGVFLITIVSGAVVIWLQRSEAAFWYRGSESSSSVIPLGVRQPTIPTGQHALELKYTTDLQINPILYQPLSASTVRALQGKTVTIGMWVWSNRPTEISPPALWIDQSLATTDRTMIDTVAKFISYPMTIPMATSQIQVVINPEPPMPTDDPLSIYFDGFVLVEDVWPQGGGLSDPDPTSESSNRGESLSVNLLRNPSFEKRWLTIDPQANRWLSRYTPIDLNQLLSAFQDLPTTGQLFKATLINLFQSFWARFGWNHIALTDGWYWGIGLFSTLGIIGGLIGIVIQSKQIPETNWVTAVWLGTAGILVWAGAFGRLGFPYLGRSLFIPSARYAFPAIIPSMLLLAYGWYFILKLIHKLKPGLIIVVIAALLLDLVSLLTIIAFYSEI